jgi:single-strand DNA-binding protein
MADARIIIEGRIATDPRFNTSGNGDPVANLRVLAGRSRKNEQGGWDTLSETAFNVAFWREHAQLVDSLRPEKGSAVVITGTVSGVESYQGERGESLSVKVTGDGLRVFPKRDQGQQSQRPADRYAGDPGYAQQGHPQGQPSYSPGQQAQGYGQQDPWAGSQPQDDRPPF